MNNAQPLTTGAAEDSNGGAKSVEASNGLLSRLLLVGATVLLCLGILEVGLRVSGRYRSGGLTGFHAPRGVSYGLAANVSKRIAWPTLTFTVYTCDQGFRATRPGPRSLGERPYYAVLGSSEVFGNGLDYEKTLVGVFAEKMERDGIDIINLASPGHHLMEQDSLFREYAASAKHQPQVVLICVNPLFIGGYDDIHKGTVVKMGHLFEEDSWRMALAKTFLSSSSATYCFFRDSIRNAQLKYLSRDNYDLSFYITRYSTKHPIRTPEKTADFLKQLKDLEEYVRSLKATPVCVFLPAVGGFLLNDLATKGKLDGSQFDTAFFPELIRKHCEAEGIQFINVEPTLQALYDKGKQLNFDLDAHFNGPTSQVIGDYLYQSLGHSGKTASK